VCMGVGMWIERFERRPVSDGCCCGGNVIILRIISISIIIIAVSLTIYRHFIDSLLLLIIITYSHIRV